MNRPNVVGLRRLLTSMKETNRAHAAVLASLPIVATRKASIPLNFSSEATVLQAGNGFGKSAVLKSLYNALGAEPPRIDAHWRSANVHTLLEFTVDGVPTLSSQDGAPTRYLTLTVSFSFARHLSAKT
jgi:hypothetical protein